MASEDHSRFGMAMDESFEDFLERLQRDSFVLDADDQSFGVEAYGNAPDEDCSGTLSAADLSNNNPNDDVHLVQTASHSLEQLTDGRSTHDSDTREEACDGHKNDLEPAEEEIEGGEPTKEKDTGSNTLNVGGSTGEVTPDLGFDDIFNYGLFENDHHQSHKLKHSVDVSNERQNHNPQGHDAFRPLSDAGEGPSSQRQRLQEPVDPDSFQPLTGTPINSDQSIVRPLRPGQSESPGLEQPYSQDEHEGAQQQQHCTERRSEDDSRSNVKQGKQPEVRSPRYDVGNVPDPEIEEPREARQGLVRGMENRLEWYDPEDREWKAAVRHHDIRRELQRRAQQDYPGMTYRHPDKNGGDPFNDTSFFIRHSTWGMYRKDRPEITWQWQMEPKDEKDPDYPDPGPMLFDGRVVLDPVDNPVTDHWNIPATLSPWTCGSKMEAMSRENPYITHRDLLARMPRHYVKPRKNQPAIWKELGCTNSRINMPMVRFRLLAGCQSWIKRDRTDVLTQGLLKFYASHSFDPVAFGNATKNFGRDLEGWEIKQVKLGNAGESFKKPEDGAIDENERRVEIDRKIQQTHNGWTNDPFTPSRKRDYRDADLDADGEDSPVPQQYGYSSQKRQRRGAVVAHADFQESVQGMNGGVYNPAHPVDPHSKGNAPHSELSPRLHFEAEMQAHLQAWITSHQESPPTVNPESSEDQKQPVNSPRDGEKYFMDKLFDKSAEGLPANERLPSASHHVKSARERVSGQGISKAQNANGQVEPCGEGGSASTQKPRERPKRKRADETADQGEEGKEEETYQRESKRRPTACHRPEEVAPRNQVGPSRANLNLRLQPALRRDKTQRRQMPHPGWSDGPTNQSFSANTGGPASVVSNYLEQSAVDPQVNGYGVVSPDLDYRFVDPKSEAERQKIDEALQPTREAFFEWTGMSAPVTGRNASYLVQWSQVHHALVYHWTMTQPEGAASTPYLIQLPEWHESLMNQPAFDTRDPMYFLAWKYGHRAPRTVDGQVIDVRGETLVELGKLRGKDRILAIFFTMSALEYRANGRYWEKDL